MLKIILALVFLFGLVVSHMQDDTPAAFSLDRNPVRIYENQTYTTSFVGRVGSQWYIHIPENASAMHITWERSPASDTCSTATFLYGRWGSFPCTSENYHGELGGAQCRQSLTTQLLYVDSSTLSKTVSITVANGRSKYTSSPGGDSFITGDYYYLASSANYDTSCYSSVSVSFDYCEYGTIAQQYYIYNSNEVLTRCIAFTEVTEGYIDTPYHAYGSLTGYSHALYVIEVPSGASGIWMKVSNITTSTPRAAIRLGSGGDGYGGGADYDAYISDRSYDNGVYTLNDLWLQNPIPGRYVLTFCSGNQAEDKVTDFEIEFAVYTCTANTGSDKVGNCSYPVEPITIDDLSSGFDIEVGPYDPITMKSAGFNMQFLEYTVPAYTFAFVNLTIDIKGDGRIFVRKNGFPTSSWYDRSFTSSTTMYFTPEDFYLPEGITYEILLGNVKEDASASFAVTASVLRSGPSPSPVPESPSPSSYPSNVPSPSQGPSDDGSSNASSIVVGVFALLAAIVVLF